MQINYILILNYVGEKDFLEKKLSTITITAYKRVLDTLTDRNQHYYVHCIMNYID